MNVLEVGNLKKAYGTLVAVDAISFTVAKGEIVGLLGPNGAGKTTTINMVLGVLEPTGGTIEIAGDNLAEERERALRKTNFAAMYAQLMGNLSVRENLRFFSLLYDVRDFERKIEEVIQQFDLSKFEQVPVGALSSGEQTRAGLAKAFVTEPELLLLDEPTASLDPSIARTIRARIKEYATDGRGGVLWTSHNMYEVEDVCDRVLFMSHGKILLSGDPKKLPAEHGKKNLEELFITIANEPLSLEQPDA
jgi:ABC-2 type transport system ATP-binding protein